MQSEHKNKYTIVVAWSSLRCPRISPWHTVVVEFCLLSHCQNSLILDSWLLSHSQNNLISVPAAFMLSKQSNFRLPAAFTLSKCLYDFRLWAAYTLSKQSGFRLMLAFTTFRNCLISDYWLITHSLSTTTKKAQFQSTGHFHTLNSLSSDRIPLPELRTTESYKPSTAATVAAREEAARGSAMEELMTRASSVYTASRV